MWAAKKNLKYYNDCGLLKFNILSQNLISQYLIFLIKLKYNFSPYGDMEKYGWEIWFDNKEKPSFVTRVFYFFTENRDWFSFLSKYLFILWCACHLSLPLSFFWFSLHCSLLAGRWCLVQASLLWYWPLHIYHLLGVALLLS